MYFVPVKRTTCPIAAARELQAPFDRFATSLSGPSDAPGPDQTGAPALWSECLYLKLVQSLIMHSQRMVLDKDAVSET